MQKELNFTIKALKELPSAEKGKRYSVKDTKEDGLILRVSDVGNKVFALYKKFNGRPVKITFGKFGDISIEQARKMAKVEKGKLAEGINTNIEKQNFRKEATLKHLFEEYMERYLKVEKKSWQYDEREIPKFLGHWFNKKLTAITHQEIRKLHETTFAESGLYQANRVLERLRAMYNKAKEWGYIDYNPTDGIKKYKEVKRDDSYSLMKWCVSLRL